MLLWRRVRQLPTAATEYANRLGDLPFGGQGYDVDVEVASRGESMYQRRFSTARDT
jgi:hypothetical protein